MDILVPTPNVPWLRPLGAAVVADGVIDKSSRGACGTRANHRRPELAFLVLLTPRGTQLVHRLPEAVSRAAEVELVTHVW